MKILKKKSVQLGIITILLVGVGLYLFIHNAYSYQIKRVVRGTVTFPLDIQAGTIDISGSLGGTPLVTNSSIVSINWRMTDEERNKSDYLVTIDDPENILIARWTENTATDINWEVIEFNSGVRVVSGITVVPETRLVKNITLPSSFNLTRTLPIVFWRSALAANANDEVNEFAVKFIANDTLQFSRIENLTANNEISYQIIEFDRDVKVYNGTTEITSGNRAADQTLSPSVAANKSLLVYYTYPGDSNINGSEDYFLIDGYIVNDTTLRFTRGGTVFNTTAYWYLAEFQNNAWAESNRKSFAATANQSNTTLSGTPVMNLTRTFGKIPRASIYSNNNTGRYESALFTGDIFESGTNLNLSLRRQPGIANQVVANVSYSVIELPPLDVLSPNGGETWKSGETKNITWALADSSKDHNLDLRLCTSGCDQISSYTTLIASGENASNNSYPWLITDSVGGTNPINRTLRVAVVDTTMTPWASTKRDSSSFKFWQKSRVTLMM